MTADLWHRAARLARALSDDSMDEQAHARAFKGDPKEEDHALGRSSAYGCAAWRLGMLLDPVGLTVFGEPLGPPAPIDPAELIRLPKGHRFATCDEEDERLRWARRFVERLEDVGQGLGYGIFHGGSLLRDIDVVAVPFQEPTCDGGSADFVMKLVERMGLRWPGGMHTTVYGHTATTLWAPGRNDHAIDLKIMERAA